MARRPVLGRNLAFAGVLLLNGAGPIWARFLADMDAARDSVGRGGSVIATLCSAIEYQQAGAGMPLLAVHGSGSGLDQGMAFTVFPLRWASYALGFHPVTAEVWRLIRTGGRPFLPSGIAGRRCYSMLELQATPGK